jgi:hypothetical protein
MVFSLQEAEFSGKGQMFRGSDSHNE